MTTRGHCADDHKVWTDPFHDMDTFYFYLSFENSLCDEYITEKFFRVLQTNTVPVVMGPKRYLLFTCISIKCISYLTSYLNHFNAIPILIASILLDYISNNIITLGFFLNKSFYFRSNYDAYAPPNSYIHISDFDSPKELAEYLIHLQENPG